MNKHSFQEVMRQWGRYCKGYTENHNDDCVGCPFEINGSCNSYAKDNAQYAEQIEKHIMAWAADYPEPVYPAWEQVIAEMYLRSGRTKYHNISEWMRNEPIPADIAEKLGIEPKEGVC